MVICLDQGADCLHMVISCVIKIQTGFTLLVPAYPDCPGKGGSGGSSSSSSSSFRMTDCFQHLTKCRVQGGAYVSFCAILMHFIAYVIYAAAAVKPLIGKPVC